MTPSAREAADRVGRDARIGTGAAHAQAEAVLRELVVLHGRRRALHDGDAHVVAADAIADDAPTPALHEDPGATVLLDGAALHTAGRSGAQEQDPAGGVARDGAVHHDERGPVCPHDAVVEVVHDLAVAHDERRVGAPAYRGFPIRGTAATSC